MLAYIFWHWRYPNVEKTTYQQYLVDFHETLRTQKPRGFQYSAVLQFEHAPWIGGNEEGYEDWYIVDNSAALDVLNEAAVSAPCQEPHKRVASCAAGGTGGLYRLHSGQASLATVRTTLWFTKPSGMSYEQLYNILDPEVKQAAGSLWRRQMTLGPAREFCWHSSEDHGLPEIFDCLRIPVTQVWLG
jgi:hypothetical protein